MLPFVDASRRLASVTLAVCALAGSGLVSLYGLVNGVLGCDDGCSIRTGDWAENKNAWQWHAAVAVSMIQLLAAIVLVVGIAKAGSTTGRILAFSGFLGQGFALAIWWLLVSSSPRHEPLTERLAFLSLIILGTAATAILLRPRY